MRQSLEGGLEENVLTAMVWIDAIAPVIAMQVTAELFTTRHFKTIAKASLDHIVRYGVAPKQHILDILETEIDKAESGKLICQALARMQEVAPTLQAEYITNELEGFVRLNTLRLKLQTAFDLVYKGDIEKAEEAIHKIDVGNKLTPGIRMSNVDQALAFLDKDKEEDEFRLGIEALDVRGIRPARKTELVILAPKKKGKSHFLVNVGKQAAFVDRKKVLHVTLEMSEDEVAKRYVQSITGMRTIETDNPVVSIANFKRDTYGNYLGIEYEDVEPVILNRNSRNLAAKKLRTSRGSKNLIIKEFPTGELTTAQLILFLDYLKKAHDFEPDMVIVDYANLMHMLPQHVRTETGRLFRELRGIAVRYNLALVTAAQGNRLSESSRVVNAAHLAEDWSIAGTADILLTICQTPEEKQKRLARIFVAAARSVPCEYFVQISQNFETCNFAVDSIYMNKASLRDINLMLEGEDV